MIPPRVLVEPQARVAVPTGDALLDAALGGGLPLGAITLVEGPDGAGATEFALASLRAVAKAGHVGRFLTALRSALRVEREAASLFESAKDASMIGVQAADRHVAEECMKALRGLATGDLLVVEALSALHHEKAEGEPESVLRRLGDTASSSGVTVLLLHTPGSVPAEVEALARETVDAHFVFGWRDGGSTRQHTLTVPKLRGLAPALEGAKVTVFEVLLERGAGFVVSTVKNVA